MGRGFWKAVGPGILFAGAAIGVSHLVQSTRAGALFGLWLLPVVLLAHAAKYPAMVFGPRYAAATGRSLIEAYREQGRHALGLFALIAIGTSFTILAAVTMVTAAVVRTSLGLEGVSVVAIAAGLLVLSALTVACGGFRWLDALLKVLMVLLLAATLVAAGSALPRMEWAAALIVPAGLGLAALPFVVGLVGWMPAPLDITVWHSLWTLDRAKQTGHTPTHQQCRADFDIGYALCAVTACSFLLLGAVLMHQRGVETPEGSAPFVAQLFDLYAEAIGAWVRPVIAVAASAVMLSTTLTVFDALPRTAQTLTSVAMGRERPAVRSRLYWGFTLLISFGAIAIIYTARHSLVPLVHLATTISFVGTPLLAAFNHRAMHSAAVPAAHRPGKAMRRASLACVWLWAGFAVLYVWQLVVGF